MVRQAPGGRAYLDAWFEEHQLFVEIDGDRVLRINVIGWRLKEEASINQVAAALRSPWALANAAEYRRRTGGSR